MKNKIRITLPVISIIVIFIAIAFSSNTQSKNREPNSPLIFVDNSYRGNYIEVTQCSPDLHAYGFGDKVSSCKVPTGWQLVFYIDKGYCGETWTVDSDVSDFKYHGKFDDNVSAVDVYYNGKLQGYSYTCPNNQKPNTPQQRDPDRH